MVKKRKADISVTASSGNVFADLGLPGRRAGSRAAM